MPKTLSLMMALLALNACTKTIPVQLDSYEERVAIESLLLPGTTPIVHVNKTVPFFAQDVTPSELFVRGADVVIASSDGVDILRVDSTYSRFWCRWEPFYEGSTVIKKDTEYTLTVTVRGETYSAGTVTNIPSVTITSTDYVETFTDIYGGHEGVIVDFMDLAGQPNQYRFRMDRVLNNRHTTVDDFEYSSTCMADDETTVLRELGRFVYFDRGVDGASVRFVIEPAHTHKKGDTGVIWIQSLNLDAAEYYDKLDRQREANINPFIEPVFLDNKIEGAIGVFGAIAQSPPVDYVFPIDAAP